MSREKMYDIRPPAEARQREVIIKETRTYAKDVSLAVSKKTNPLSAFKKKKPWFFLFFLVITAGFFLLHFSSKAQIEIWPAQREIIIDKEILADANPERADAGYYLIKAAFIEKEKEIAEDFSASGQTEAESKARGTIEIINDYHLDQILVEKTRFLSSEGKLFYLKERVTIPARSSILAKVEAAEAGPEYNIKPSAFSVPGLLGSPRYSFVFGRSSEAMSGGYIGRTAQITAADQEKAREALIEKAGLVLSEELKKEAGDQFTLVKEAIKLEVLETSFSLGQGEKSEKFNLLIRVRARGLAFDQDEFNTLMRRLVEKEVLEDEKIKDETWEVNLTVKELSLEKGRLLLETRFSAIVLRDFDKQDFKKSLAGRSLEEARSFLFSYEKIEAAKIKVFPFWISKMPQEEQRIQVQIVGEEVESNGFLAPFFKKVDF